MGVGDPLRIVNGLPMWGEPMPWKTTPETPNLGKIDATDDQRPGLGFAGLDNLRQFVQQGGLLVGVEDTAQLLIATGLAPGVRVANPKNLKVVGSVLDARFPDPTSPIVAGLGDRLSVYSAEGMSFELSNSADGRLGPEEADRPTGRGGPKDTDTPQGRPAQPSAAHPHESRALGSPAARDRRAAQQPLRDPRGPPPADRGAFRRRRRSAGLRPARRTAASWPAAAAVVEVPVGKGRVLLFAINPVWRGSTVGSHPLVWNAILQHGSFEAAKVRRCLPTLLVIEDNLHFVVEDLL